MRINFLNTEVKAIKVGGGGNTWPLRKKNEEQKTRHWSGKKDYRNAGKMHTTCPGRDNKRGTTRFITKDKSERGGEGRREKLSYEKRRAPGRVKAGRIQGKRAKRRLRAGERMKRGATKGSLDRSHTPQNQKVRSG